MARPLKAIVQQYMDRDNISVQQLAATLDVTYQTIRNILDGKAVSAKFVVAFAENFGISERSEVQELLDSFSILNFGHMPYGQTMLKNAGLTDESTNQRAAADRD